MRTSRTSSLAKLAPQTRIHWRANGSWVHGRVIDHFLNTSTVVARSRDGELRISDSQIVVRPRRRLDDATLLLSERWIESRRFHDGRHSFVEAYLDRVNAYCGITAIASAAIELHAHQVEAVRRVLADPVQRYLLADEVGLGKTVEAGLLIRQHLLDRLEAAALVVVPPTLEDQWRVELEAKFRLFTEFESRVEVVGFDYLDTHDDRSVSMLVVDEAHRITAGEPDLRRYETLRGLAEHIPAVLLLSATPLLQETASLQRMLVLLAPGAKTLEDPAGFQRALARRDEIGVFFGSLRADVPPVFLRQAISGLRTTLAEDSHLQRLLDETDAALAGEGEEQLARSIRRARSHISEAHRIYNRMIRTRRGAGLAEDFPVLGRFEPSRLIVADAITAVAGAYNAWQEHVQVELARTDSEAQATFAKDLSLVAEALSSGGSGLIDAIDVRLQHNGVGSPGDVEQELLCHLRESALARTDNCPRTRAVIKQALSLSNENAKVVIAAGSERYADLLLSRFGDSDSKLVLRVSADESSATRTFDANRGGAILIIGRDGEEGLNLQSADAVIHADLPWDPNRLEQRMGRFDRFGAGLGARHYVFLDDADTPANGWFDLLSDGFGLFRDSIASLQLAISRLMPGVVLSGTRLGAEGFREIVPEVAEQLEQELSAVELAELLDETTIDAIGQKLLNDIENAESSAAIAEWQTPVVRWAAGEGTSASHLRFHHDEEQGQHRFALTRYRDPNIAALRDGDLPLISWTELDDRFATAWRAAN